MSSGRIHPERGQERLPGEPLRTDDPSAPRRDPRARRSLGSSRSGVSPAQQASPHPRTAAPRRGPGGAGCSPRWPGRLVQVEKSLFGPGDEDGLRGDEVWSPTPNERRTPGRPGSPERPSVRGRQPPRGPPPTCRSWPGWRQARSSPSQRGGCRRGPGHLPRRRWSVLGDVCASRAAAHAERAIPTRMLVFGKGRSDSCLRSP